MRFPAVVPCIFLLLASVARADDWKPVTPEDLKYTEAGVPAVILYESQATDDNYSSRRVYRRIKILSEEGKKYADVSIPYDRGSMKIEDVRARTIRPDGSIVNFDGKVFEKTVVKGHNVRILEKTFTLPDAQVGSIIEYKFGLFWDDKRLAGARWIVQDELKKKQAYYSFKPYMGDVRTSRGDTGSGVFWANLLPPGNKINKNINGVIDMNISEVPAFQEEEFMPPPEVFKYRVLFYYGGGRDLTNVQQFWKDEAKHFNKEINRFASSGGAVEDLLKKAGVAPGDAPEVKARKIYTQVQKLQNLTYDRERTTAEQLRANYKPPKNAEDVARAGMGFRDDITRLYIAAARAAGLKAYGMEVSTRDELFFTKNIPDYEQLNSEIAVVDIGGGKEEFVDPGTRYCPFGLIHWKRTNVTGIRQMPDGNADFSDTPMADVNKALTVRVAQLALAEDGSAKGQVALTMYGQEALLFRLRSLETDEQGRKKDLEDDARELLPVGSEITLAELTDFDATEKPVVAVFNVTIPQIAAAAGKRMLLPSSLFAVNRKQMLTHSQRTQPVYFSYPYREIDKVIITVPSSLKAETMPPPKDVNVGIALYKNKSNLTGTQLVLDRDFAVLGLGVKLDDYPKLKGFFETVKSSDDEQLVLHTAAAGASTGGR